ncbi:sugar phosphate isomerase/epimerase [Candidatus Bathyarchaeota archaeon]|nr:sugar phosphate isomerase/epimerase [Candidatus Bathyarchaeota archaeon]
MFKNLNPNALGFQASFHETIDLANLGGFEGMDINILEARSLLKESSVMDIKSLMGGLRLGGWALPVDFRGGEEKYEGDLKNLPILAKIADEIGCYRAFTWIVPFSDSLPFNENFEFHVRRLKPIAEILEDYGCLLGLEFVAPKTLRVGHKYEFICTMDGMLKLCDAIGTENAGLLLDSWHWYTSHGTVEQIRGLRSRQIVYVHINDAPQGIPVDEQRDNVRRLPGETGVIDIVGFLRALRDVGYDGPITPEPFDERLRSLPIREAVRKSGEAVRRVWSLSGL